MKKILLVTFCCFTLNSLICAQAANEKYDSVLAKKLGADDYGMKMYVFVILKSGSNTMADKAKEDSVFQGHLNNISRLAAAGKLVLAGPFGKNDDHYSGIFIFNVSDLKEVKELLATDPAIQAKLLEPFMYPWYGTAALQEIPGLHKKIQKTNF
ncbi:MAG TPA: YciI family protein [Chitinophagaceae bacterium]|nr:YciI family protein [Chitinophagaceae bacterium]